MKPHAALILALSLVSGTPSRGGEGESLDAILTPHLERHKVPALAAAVIKDGVIVASGAVGTRRVGADIPVTRDDRFHLGSDTKAMTALLAGMLVDEGKLRWDSTVAELFPELAGTMDARLRTVTLTQLLSHTSGVPGDDEAFDKLLGGSLTQDGNLDELRYGIVREYAKRPLAAKPGEKFAYANMNYLFAGSAVERIAGKTWEELVTERVFEPLGLKTAGLGPQSTVGRVDAPLGHVEVDGKVKAFLAGPNGDNPLVIGPAGTAHMSALDFARWAGWHAGGGKRGPALVKPDTLAKLHAMAVTIPAKKDAPPGTPALGRYGLGMGEMTVPWSKEPLLYHGGSNTKNLAHIWINPQRDFALVVLTNIGGPRAEAALRAVAEDLYKRRAD
ncbi:serine hydrolase domain-containing protein [Paludisphaera borealis]|uniref:D-alanyl-D-alanine carboxypeptidase n=1 Tax=Paludisphaera borealis TaxID=1387353 RepID=A0A1U7CSJ2_9BACT|nr:serine hydrolase domain-containing protein [Paludisphaera borealis]APW61901.1 D-alanyl-D-alanine carboxypeptidase [Paludisphaera borealis]